MDSFGYALHPNLRRHRHRAVARLRSLLAPLRGRPSVVGRELAGLARTLGDLQQVPLLKDEMHRYIRFLDASTRLLEQQSLQSANQDTVLVQLDRAAHVARR